MEEVCRVLKDFEKRLKKLETKVGSSPPSNSRKDRVREPSAGPAPVPVHAVVQEVNPPANPIQLTRVNSDGYVPVGEKKGRFQVIVKK